MAARVREFLSTSLSLMAHAQLILVTVRVNDGILLEYEEFDKLCLDIYSTQLLRVRVPGGHLALNN